MSFHCSASDIELIDGHILKAVLDNGEGDQNESHFDLNECIGNNDGRFEWGGENFSHSAEEIHFTLDEREDGPAVPILRAQLGNMEGEMCYADINLGERITNNGGNLEFQ
ncbi:hypothetical protein N7539_000005 [Penicillium diatomitis]|uniref:Cyanovirin-N domain-containing protein n=1 Tax=Penicillium diatomitis TaxID=2819901 RepID=A0A9X0C2B3_9EURO|nr:uncharacterized protein N7539_000005 [Penicillium diatomitis]KAJ5494889.1 hypothetical protein N7539_000005 [Penicillium diatomitis]